jgi:hypothetical protein
MLVKYPSFENFADSIMALKKRTRSMSGDKFGGCACDLPESDLPTYSDIACYFYFVSLNEKEFLCQMQLVQDKLISVWSTINPRVPLLDKKCLYNKMKYFLDNVKDFNRKTLKASRKKVLELQKDRLFDISACTCELPTAPCNSLAIKCSVENCNVQHIACECAGPKRVPDEDRLYMRDQRAKKGTRGSYQLGPVDRKAVSKEKALEAARQQKSSRLPRRRGQRHKQVKVNPTFEVGTNVLQS